MNEYFEELKSPGRRRRTGHAGRRPPSGPRLPREVALPLPRSARSRLLLSAVAVVVVAGFLTMTWVSARLGNLPDPGAAPVLAKSVVIYDRNGAVLAERNPQGTFHVVQKLAEMGRWGPLATVGAEDHDFYKHGALDPLGVARAVVVDTLARKPLEGGSTITQQLVKITVLESDKTFTRKVKEALVANQVEQRYSKDQILEMYLNRVYYGHGAYGIGSATKTYFGAGKNTSDLTIAQAAFLAGLIQAPSGDDPQLHFDRARARELYVLGEMQKAGFISSAQETDATREDIERELVYDTSYRETRAPHFVDYIMGKIKDQFGPYALQRGGLSVYTTIDPAIQSLAEASVTRGTGDLARMGVNNGDLLAARPATGEILAWVGSADYGNATIGGQFDVIRSARQPGSSFKPYVYEAALKDHRITLNSCVDDRPYNYPGTNNAVHDFDNAYMGRMTARQALVLSRNVPAVKVGVLEGINNVISLANAMGISSKLNPYPSTAIGGSEVTMFDHLQGYQVFANEGHKVPLISITRITDATGATVYQVNPGQQEGQRQVLTPAEAYLLTDTLKAYQNQWNLGWGRQMASKSGTTGGNASGIHPDAWMMAYNKDIVVGTWAGNTGANGAGHATSAYGVNAGETTLAYFINGLPAAWSHWYQRPADIVQKGSEIYLPGTQDMPACGGGQEQQGGDSNTPTPFFGPGPGGKKHGHG